MNGFRVNIVRQQTGKITARIAKAVFINTGDAKVEKKNFFF